MSESNLEWRELFFTRPLDEVTAVEATRRLVDDPSSPVVAFELRAQAGALRLLGGAERHVWARLERTLGVSTVHVAERQPVQTARTVRLSSQDREFATDALDLVAVSVHAALAQTRGDEVLVLQLLLGPHYAGRVAPRETAPSLTRELLGSARPQTAPALPTATLRKRARPSFGAVVRLGVTAATSERRRALLLGVLGALRRVETAGVRLRLRSEAATRLEDAVVPWRWPLRLSEREAVAFAGWPVGEELPGLPSLHPVPLAPTFPLVGPSRRRIVLAEATAPGTDGVLSLSVDAVLRGVHLLGPIGVGKSDAGAQLARQWIGQGRAAVVLEPKRDLCDQVLGRLSAKEHKRVAYVDLLSPSEVIGFNPLRADGRAPELVADGIVRIFATVLSDVIGVTTRDVLFAAVLTLVRTPGATLLMLPKLLGDAAFRRATVERIAGDVFLAGYWAEFEQLSDGARQSLVGPVLTRLRQILLRPALRNCLGQPNPRFDVRRVFDGQQRVLLVPLLEAQLGRDGVALFGALLLHTVFGAIRERAIMPAADRHPVMVMVDEWHRFIGGGDGFEEALTLFRGWGVGFVLANQVLAQLPPALRSVALGTVRSQVYFQLGYDDASAVARGHDELTATDLMRLDQFHVYAALYESGRTRPFVSGRTLPLPTAIGQIEELRAASSQRYGTPLVEVQRHVDDLYGEAREPEGGPTDGEPATPATPKPTVNVGRRSPRREPPGSTDTTTTNPLTKGDES